MTHTILALVDNNPGVVSRVSGLFTRRGYNIESLVTGVTDNPAVYHLTILVNGTEEQRAELVALLSRIQEVIRVIEPSQTPHVTREMMLLRVSCAPEERPALHALAEKLALRIVAEGSSNAVLEATGSPAELLQKKESIETRFPVESVRGGAICVVY